MKAFSLVRSPALLCVALLFLGCQAQSSDLAAQTPPPAAGVTNSAATNTVIEANSTASEVPSVEINLPAHVAEIIKLAEGGLGDDVLITYIRNSPLAFQLSAEEIVYLTDLGISEEVITAMLNHRPATGAGSEPAPAAAQPAATSIVTAATRTPSVSIDATPEFEAVPQTPEVVYAPPAQVQYATFYTALAPYGSWVQVENYGLCWQPTVTVIDRSWKPYCHRGRWLYTDHGWYWQSDYSWGWAPFHYGRWHSHPNRGWVWSPDTTWGPAWVSWRYSDRYCGWAPLPPGARYDAGFGLRYHSARVGFSFDFGLSRDCYTFVPASRFCDRSPWRHRLAHHEVANVYNRTTIVNNYVRGSNNTIINEGIGRDRVASLTRSEIRKVTVRDGDPSVRPDKLVRTGRGDVIYRSNPVTATPDRRSAQFSGRTSPQAGGAAPGFRSIPINRVAPAPSVSRQSLIGSAPTKASPDSRERISSSVGGSIPVRNVTSAPTPGKSAAEARERISGGPSTVRQPAVGELSRGVSSGIVGNTRGPIRTMAQPNRSPAVSSPAPTARTSISGQTGVTVPARSLSRTPLEGITGSGRQVQQPPASAATTRLDPRSTVATGSSVDPFARSSGVNSYRSGMPVRTTPSVVGQRPTFNSVPGSGSRTPSATVQAPAPLPPTRSIARQEIQRSTAPIVVPRGTVQSASPNYRQVSPPSVQSRPTITAPSGPSPRQFSAPAAQAPQYRSEPRRQSSVSVPQSAPSRSIPSMSAPPPSSGRSVSSPPPAGGSSSGRRQEPRR